MTRTTKTVVAAVVASVAIGAGLAAAATAPTVTITSPTEGQVISKGQNPKFTATGGVTFVKPKKTSTPFYLRRDDCGGDADNPHLSVVDGTDPGDSCGFVVGILGPGAELAELSVDYPATDGLPATLDATAPIAGTIDLENFQIQGNGIGAGDVTVDVTLTGVAADQGVTIGTASQTVSVAPPNTSYPVDFEITPDPSLAKKDVTALNLNVYIHGTYAFSGFIGNSGKSYMTLPTYSASFARSVKLSIDDQNFRNPIKTKLSRLTSWSATVKTPDKGDHTLYAQAIQGATSSDTASVHFTVTN
jgi:hypothetical protein